MADRLDEIDEALLSLGCDVLSDTEERLRQICCELSAELRRVRDASRTCDERGCDMFGHEPACALKGGDT